MEDLLNNIGALEVILAFIVGLSPTIISAVRDRAKWKDEKTVVQTEATENIVQAASMLAERSQALMEKNDKLIGTYEDALERQVKQINIERENVATLRKQRMEQEKEIGELKEQVKTLQYSVVACSRELVTVIRDLSKGETIAEERLQQLEKIWSKSHK